MVEFDPETDTLSIDFEKFEITVTYDDSGATEHVIMEVSSDGEWSETLILIAEVIGTI